MTDRIKLTEDDILAGDGNIPDDMGSSMFGIIVKLKIESKEYPDWEIESTKKAEEMKQQILENQEIVENLQSWRGLLKGSLKTGTWTMQQILDEVESILTGDKK